MTIPFFFSSSAVPDDFEGSCHIASKEVIYWLMKGKVWHRLDGPAILYGSGGVYGKNGKKLFFIDDIQIPEEEYWNHPKVTKYKLQMMLNDWKIL